MRDKLTVGPLSIQYAAHGNQASNRYLPATHERHFFDIPVVVIYMDDTIVFGYADLGRHLVDITEVLRRLQEAGFQVNPDKCLWFQPAVTYLGFLITRDGIKPQPDKIQGIIIMQRPKSQQDVHHFVGMVNFNKVKNPIARMCCHPCPIN